MMMRIRDRARHVGELLLKRRWWIAVAESCTGGLLGGTLTDIPGSSRYFRGGVIAYHNRVKEEVLRVPQRILLHFGAVSEPTALLMAQGVRDLLQTDVGVGITGIAGPTGGTPEKPVGLVYIGVLIAGESHVFRHTFSGDRQAVRLQTVEASLEHLEHLLTALDRE